LMALAVMVVLALVPWAWRWPGVNPLLGILLQIGLGLAAAVLLDRFLDGYALLAGVAMSALVLAGVYLKPPEFPLVRDVLRWSPFIMLLTLAALAAIPHSIHEAAEIDRASAWFELGNVTMPLVAPLLLGGLVFRVVDAFAAPRPFEYVLRAYGVLVAGIALGEIVVRVRRGAWR